MGRSLVAPWSDFQDRLPDARCTRCEGELWGTEAEPDERGHTLCQTCQEDLDTKYDADTVMAVLEAYDLEVKKYLSDDLRDTIWNEMVRRFPAKAAG